MKQKQIIGEAKKLFHKKKYEFETKQGDKVKVKIEAKIEKTDKTALKEILHELAKCEHDFYLSLGREISNTL